jgi:hypothetical protein
MKADSEGGHQGVRSWRQGSAVLSGKASKQSMKAGSQGGHQVEKDLGGEVQHFPQVRPVNRV